MSNVSIYGKKWIDLVFEDKNQMYGAYQLRQENPRVTLLALFYGVLLFGGIASVLIISSLWSNNKVVEPATLFPEDYIIKVTNFTQPIEQPKIEDVKVTPPNTVTEPIEQPINLLSNLVVTQTQQSVDVPTNKDLENIVTPSIQGATTTLGIGTEPGTGSDNGALVGNGNSTSGTGKDILENAASVDQLPAFPGGIEKFYLYVANNFRNTDLDSGAIISVLVAFVVEKDGTLSNIKVIRNSGKGVDKEAIRVLSSMKAKWVPGIKNGQKVRTEFTLPIKVKFN